MNPRGRACRTMDAGPVVRRLKATRSTVLISNPGMARTVAPVRVDVAGAAAGGLDLKGVLARVPGGAVGVAEDEVAVATSGLLC